MIKQKKRNTVITDVYYGVSDCRSLVDLARHINALNRRAHNKFEPKFRVVGGPVTSKLAGTYGALLVRKDELDLDE